MTSSSTAEKRVADGLIALLIYFCALYFEHEMSLVWLAAILLLSTQSARAQPGDAWVPGGVKALAAMAHLQSSPSPQDFFLEYCRALIWEQSPWNRARPPGYTGALQAYIDTAAELRRLGEPDAAIQPW